MAVNRTAKGNLIELEAKAILEAQGWSVFRQSRKAMFIKGRMIMVGNDIFGCDIVCKAKGRIPLWVQVSMISEKAEKQKQIMQFPWNFAFESAQLWLRVNGERLFRVFEAPDFNEVASFSCLSRDKRKIFSA